MRPFWRSRKFWAAVVGGVVACLPVPSDVKPYLVTVVGTYILGQGIADTAKPATRTP